MFIALGIWLIVSRDIGEVELWHIVTIPASALGYSAVVFFGLCLFAILRNAIRTKIALRIDEQGITDNSSMTALGLIKWSDIVDISIVELHRQKMIQLYLANPEEYISSVSSPAKRKILQLNYKSSGTPVSISASALKISFDDLLALITKGVEDNGAQPEADA